MPYKLRKAPNRDLYWVVSDDGKKMSKDPIPKERAKAQMKALYANVKDLDAEPRPTPNKGKGYSPLNKMLRKRNAIKKANEKRVREGLEEAERRTDTAIIHGKTDKELYERLGEHSQRKYDELDALFERRKAEIREEKSALKELIREEEDLTVKNKLMNDLRRMEAENKEEMEKFIKAEKDIDKIVAREEAGERGALKQMGAYDFFKPTDNYAVSVAKGEGKMRGSGLIKEEARDSMVAMWDKHQKMRANLGLPLLPVYLLNERIKDLIKTLGYMPKSGTNSARYASDINMDKREAKFKAIESAVRQLANFFKEIMKGEPIPPPKPSPSPPPKPSRPPPAVEPPSPKPASSAEDILRKYNIPLPDDSIPGRKDEAKKAYRDACRIHHPDKGGDEEVCKDIIGAYQKLYGRGRYGKGRILKKGAGAIPPRNTLHKIAEQSYKSSPAQSVDGMNLIFQNATLKAYAKDNTIVVGIRGTVPTDGSDLKADASIVAGRLASSDRYKKDVRALRMLQKTHSPTEWDYYGVGHSLGGAILDLLIQQGLLKNGVSYNPAVQPQDIRSTNASNTRIYSEGDPLYKTIGQALSNKPEVRKGKDKAWYQKLVSYVPWLGTALDSYKAHGLDNFEGGGTHREDFLKKWNVKDKSYSLAQLAKISSVPIATLREVYNRGIGAYKTNPTSVRLKGSYVKGVNAPMSKKLSKEQWAMARVYSFLDGNAKHDNDLRLKGGRNWSQFLAEAYQNLSPAIMKWLFRRAVDTPEDDFDDLMAMTVDSELEQLGLDPNGVAMKWLMKEGETLWNYLRKNKKGGRKKGGNKTTTTARREAKPWTTTRPETRGIPLPPDAPAPNFAFPNDPTPPPPAGLIPWEETRYMVAEEDEGEEEGSGRKRKLKGGYFREFRIPVLNQLITALQNMRAGITANNNMTQWPVINNFINYIDGLDEGDDFMGSLVGRYGTHAEFNNMTNTITGNNPAIHIPARQTLITNIIDSIRENIGNVPGEIDRNEREKPDMPPPKSAHGMGQIFSRGKKNKIAPAPSAEELDWEQRMTALERKPKNTQVAPAPIRIPTSPKKSLSDIIAEDSPLTPLSETLFLNVDGKGKVAERPTPGNPKFLSQLSKVNISPSSYLNEVRKRAKANHYPYKLLGFSDDGVHKLQIPDKSGKIIRFGRVGYGDHIIWSAQESAQKVKKGYADSKRETFHKSHSKIKGNWKSNPFSPNNLALKILW